MPVSCSLPSQRLIETRWKRTTLPGRSSRFATHWRDAGSSEQKMLQDTVWRRLSEGCDGFMDSSQTTTLT